MTTAMFNHFIPPLFACDTDLESQVRGEFVQDSCDIPADGCGDSHIPEVVEEIPHEENPVHGHHSVDHGRDKQCPPPYKNGM